MEKTTPHQRGSYQPTQSGGSMAEIKDHTKKIQLELSSLSLEDLQLVSNFIAAIKARKSLPGVDTFLLSETSLAKDWLRPEEDKAWEDL